MITINFSMDSLDEAAFIINTVQHAARQLRADLAAKANAGTTQPALQATPACAPVSGEAPAVVAAPQPAAPVDVVTDATPSEDPAVTQGSSAPAAAVLQANLAKIPAKRGRKTNAERAAIAALAEPVTSRTGAPAPVAGPVNLFSAPAIESPTQASVAPVPPVAVSAALKPEQRQALFGGVYAMKPDGPAKAIALVKMFGVTRVPDLHPDTLADFDKLAAMVLHGTFDPRNGKPE